MQQSELIQVLLDVVVARQFVPEEPIDELLDGLRFGDPDILHRLHQRSDDSISFIGLELVAPQFAGAAEHEALYAVFFAVVAEFQPNKVVIGKIAGHISRRLIRGGDLVY